MKRLSRNGWALLVVLLAGCGGTPSKQASAPPTAAEGNDADLLAGTALAIWGTNPNANSSQALSQIQKATKAAPDRPELLWLHLQLCLEVPGCEPESIEARLRKLDPSNGAVWTGPLTRAQLRGDPRSEEQILEVMTKAGYFNVYWTTLVAKLTPPLSRTPVGTSGSGAQAIPAPVANAMNATIGWLSSLTIPEFKSVGVACDEQHIREPATRVRCQQISQALQKSDTTLAEGMGLGIAQRLAAPNSAGALQLTKQVQTLRHQNQAAGAVVAAQVEKDKFAEQMLKLMVQLKREQDVSRAILRWAGQPLTP
ncbi:hypothetical protein [Steroidobacter sp.]|uniref:hypothetical protein n=1 Tax=Steroidobacter sp. TaxID=1978227 RepID=UPI001A3F9253|nr:hypothetical protein [Steroidobacter sp.]MBL8271444.1 hypothetical protein [Steroidobacter sp.]